MLDDQDFIDYIHDSKELLKKNLQVGKIPEQFGKAVRTVVDNIEVLLQRTTKKPKSDLGTSYINIILYTYLLFIYYFFYKSHIPCHGRQDNLKSPGKKLVK